MNFTIEEIKGRKQLKKFVEFQIGLYEGVDAFVPPMIQSEVDSLDAAKNPAFEFCEVAFFVAKREEKIVGRIAGIINHRSNERLGKLQCRFCYCDFLDELELSHALLDVVSDWGRKKGMQELIGPLGMTDLDYEGCLLEGFDQLATTADLYNYPYYAHHYEAYGMKPEGFWTEYHMTMPDAIPEKHLRVAQIAKRRYGLEVLKITDAKTIVSQYGKKIFYLLNEAYGPLYGFCPLTEKQIDYYINLYLPQVRLDMIRLVVDKEDNLLAFGISCPSLSRAQQKAKGKMLPFGWIHLAKAMYMNRHSFWGRLLGGGTDTCDLLLMGVKPEMQGKGVNALLFTELIPQFMENGYTYVESNNELDDNHKIQNLWGDFIHEVNKRRCTFAKQLN